MPFFRPDCEWEPVGILCYAISAGFGHIWPIIGVESRSISRIMGTDFGVFLGQKGPN
jgi:hypothetical protein